ncbi:hypothetical protein TREPR_2494 [Treponema primitia ZAS-2]|uniref:SseB protein N-terminal domain-containing protein n=1 Tax=Treponema primitia (strain ATCC BAA-887 / DSM 12427 / ZAS-2) TaxID=545694 RepID=F5YH11_TREPZ|nr:hypothetical protein [Treponema primitia]AEF83922.1 hypothetical protein TREPR_2494 [Treponema primitia ZAS-2]
MGLLSKALSGSPSKLDDAGIALKDRLLRLSSKKSATGSSAYTALSLLKGYGAFKSGACLELKKEGYTSYVSVGMGVAKVILAPEEIDARHQSFFEINNPESLALKFFIPGMKLWIFPLDNREPKLNLLLAAEEPDAGFNPERIALILEDTKIIFTSPVAASDLLQEKAPEQTAALPAQLPAALPAELPAAEFDLEIPMEESPEISTKEEICSKINAYQKVNPQFQGIVLKKTDKGKEDFAPELRLKLGALGETNLLPSGRALLLLPMPPDRELIAHRLSISLNTEVLACFEADTPEKALELIQPYL